MASMMRMFMMITASLKIPATHTLMHLLNFLKRRITSEMVAAAIAKSLQNFN
jgi:hypothetical protein